MRFSIAYKLKDGFFLLFFLFSFEVTDIAGKKCSY